MDYEKTGKTLIIIGTCFTVFFGLEFIFNSGGLTCGPIDASIWGQYGDVVGGFVGTIVALIGVLLLFETLKAQRRTYIKQQVETRFFELLKLHRDNVTEMQSKGNNGRTVFIEIKDEFHDLYAWATHWYPLDKSGLTETVWKKNVVQIVYLITFFGVDNSSTEYLKKRINEIISNEPVYNLFEKSGINTLISNHEKTKNENKDKPKEQRIYLKNDGHQSRLGHYYRHLFQTVKYINEQPKTLFTYKEKYDYIKILRAQLGTHEQALLLYNSISPLGEPWELDAKITKENQKLITKYNLLKNIPFGFTKEIDPKDYYPNIYYEIDDKEPTKRAELEKLYIHDNDETTTDGQWPSR
ncbi:MAG: putative phage abortive infection protein [Saprospiraceae bacterium]